MLLEEALPADLTGKVLEMISKIDVSQFTTMFMGVAGVTIPVVFGVICMKKGIGWFKSAIMGL